MKAILKSNRKVIVDVVPLKGISWKDSCLWQDKKGRVYDKRVIEFVEYYGG